MDSTEVRMSQVVIGYTPQPRPKSTVKSAWNLKKQNSTPEMASAGLNSCSSSKKPHCLHPVPESTLGVAKDIWVSLQYNQCHRILHEVDVYKSQKGMTHRRTMAKSLEKREWTPSVNLLCYFCGGLCLFFFLFPWCIQRQVVQKFAQNPSVFNS